MNTDVTCPFDKLLKTNVPHIHQKIFLQLDLESFKSCLKVSNEWNKLLVEESFQRKAECVFLPDAMRQEEQLICANIKDSQRAQYYKYMLQVGMLQNILFFMLVFLCKEYFEPEDTVTWRSKSACSTMVSLYIFFIFYGIFFLILCMDYITLLYIVSTWFNPFNFNNGPQLMPLFEFRANWTEEWNNIIKTEEYKRKISSLLHNDMLGKTRRSERSEFRQDMLKREEKLRLKGLESVRKVHLLSCFNIMYTICLVGFWTIFV